MTAIRATFDTNVLVSLFVLASSLAKDLRDLWLNGAFEMALSPAILEEFKRVARYPRLRKHFALTDEEIEQFAATLSSGAILTKDQIELDVVTEDPDDNKILACALEAGSTYLVTRDQHLKKLGEYQGIKIVDPETFRGTLRKATG